jgi:hypothetical protein
MRLNGHASVIDSASSLSCTKILGAECSLGIETRRDGQMQAMFPHGAQLTVPDRQAGRR